MDFFPYVGLNWKIYQIRECQNFPYFIEKILENKPISSKMSRLTVYLEWNLKFYYQNW